MATKTVAAPKPPVDPAKYHPSRQVRHVISVIADDQYARPTMSSDMISEREQGNRIGYRHGQAIILRELVRLETRIEDSDTLDQLIGDMIEEATSWQG